MKQKGFTLIELLAVIVILAIIAVITVPKVTDMISSSRKGGAEDSFYGTLKAAELGYAKALQSNTQLSSDACDLTETNGTTLTCMNGTVINFSGKAPESGRITIINGSAIGQNITVNNNVCNGTISTSKPCENDSQTAYDKLSKNIVEVGDELYKDSYENGRFIYRGTNPKNYIIFNDNIFRIMAIEPDKTIKIISEESIGKMPFDKPETRDTSTSTYCTAASTYGCNAWSAVSGNFTNGSTTGTVTKDSSLNSYLNSDYYNKMAEIYKTKITNHSYYIGVITRENNIQSHIRNEKAVSWNGLIGLMNTSDYLRASTSALVNDTTGGQSANWQKENYLYKKSYDSWTLQPNKFVTYSAYYVGAGGDINCNSLAGRTSSNAAVRPVMFLKADTKLSGEGTIDNPYIIEAL